jgi:hypothetical protein
MEIYILQFVHFWLSLPQIPIRRTRKSALTDPFGLRICSGITGYYWRVIQEGVLGGVRNGGKTGSWYVEKLTTEWRARSKDQQTAQRFYPSCYNETIKAEQMTSVPLPGTVDVSRCTRVTADVGKCSVCGLVRAEWIDCEAGVKLCEHCYGRGVGRLIGQGLGFVERKTFFKKYKCLNLF